MRVLRSRDLSLQQRPSRHHVPIRRVCIALGIVLVAAGLVAAIVAPDSHAESPLIIFGLGIGVIGGGFGRS